MLEPRAVRNWEPVALINGAARDQISAASSREILRSTNCSEAARAVCFRVCCTGAIQNAAASAVPCPEIDCNPRAWFQSIGDAERPSEFPDDAARVLIPLQDCRIPSYIHNCAHTNPDESRTSARYVRRGTRCPVSDRSYNSRVEAPPLRTRQLSRAIGFPPPTPLLRSKERVHLSLRSVNRTGPHAYTRSAGTPCSICYNKSTILAPTRDDSIGRGAVSLALFWESRVSASRPEHDAPVIVETSSACYSPPLIPAASRSPNPPPCPAPHPSFGHSNGYLWPANRGSISLLAGRRTPRSAHVLTVLLPASEIELARNGSGSWSRGDSWSFFSSLSIVSGADSCA